MAEIVAIQALNFIAQDPDLLGRFLAESGLGPESLRQAATDPQFLAAVLDFVLRDEQRVIAFAASVDLGPETVSAAHIALAGDAWEREDP